MARLVGFIANRPDLCNRFAEHERDALRVSNGDGEARGWGVGFFHGGEILLKRRPLDDRAEIDLSEMIAEVRSDILIAHVRRATVGTTRTDNTHPFRYRHWIFANTGTVGGFGDVRTRLLESLPQFLQRALRGDTDSELLFYLYLSFLHDAGQLGDQVVPPKDVFAALKSSLGLVNRIASEAGQGDMHTNILLATPDYLVAAHRGAPMGYRVLAGREDFEPLLGEQGRGRLRMPDLEPCRLCVVASDFDDGQVPADWTEVPHGAMMAFTRTHEPTILKPR